MHRSSGVTCVKQRDSSRVRRSLGGGSACRVLRGAGWGEAGPDASDQLQLPPATAAGWDGMRSHFQRGNGFPSQGGGGVEAPPPPRLGSRAESDSDLSHVRKRVTSDVVAS